jgi:hypothetical protein
MYAWIWRHLPFGLPGKITGSLLLAGGLAALLWFVVFPWIDPFVEDTLLPWTDSQVEGDFGPADDPGIPGGSDPSPDGTHGPDEELVGPDGQQLDDEHDLPYDTGE